MAIICPTVTAENTHQFREQTERIAPFVQRIHIDFMDGLFTKNKSVEIGQAWWPHTVVADLHLMFMRPDLFLDQAIALSPSMIIGHAESKGDFSAFSGELRKAGIKVGVALLEETPVSLIAGALDEIDHVLIFSGKLGHFGGKADLKLLDKAKELKTLKPELEIGWDGGIDDENVEVLANGDVDVLNVGGFIHRSENPKAAYDKLKASISG